MLGEGGTKGKTQRKTQGVATLQSEFQNRRTEERDSGRDEMTQAGPQCEETKKNGRRDKRKSLLLQFSHTHTPHAHICICTYLHIYTCMHAYTHIKYKHTHTQMHMYTHIYKNTHTPRILSPFQVTGKAGLPRGPTVVLAGIWEIFQSHTSKSIYL